MRLEQVVMLIGTDGFMPPIGAVGEIVEAFDGEDYGVDFERHPCPVPPEPYWYVPPQYLMPLDFKPEHQETKIAELEPK